MMTPESVAKIPRPGCSVPSNLAFSPDDKILSCLLSDSDSLTKCLMGIDVEEQGLLSNHFGGEGICDTIGVNSSQMVSSPALATLKRLFTPQNENSEEETFSLKEQMQRERQRQCSGGVTSYSWSSPSTKYHGALPSPSPPPACLLIPLRGNIYVQDGWDRSTTRTLYQKDSEENEALYAQLSPDGSMVAFVLRNDIFVCPVNPTQESAGSLPPFTQLTFGACDGISNGVADFIAQEEMARYLGFWWSPDSKSIVFTHVDERHVPLFFIPQFSTSNTTAESHRYSFAGKKNCITELGVVAVDAERVKKGKDQFNLSGYNPLWLDISTPFNDKADGTAYIPRVGWLPDGSVYAQVQNRDQTHLQILRLDIITGNQTLLFEETNMVWLNLHDMMWCIPDLGSLFEATESLTTSRNTTSQQNKDGLCDRQEDSKSTTTNHGHSPFHFLWASERSGFRQLYLYEVNLDSKEKECAKLVHPTALGGPNWIVDSIVNVDTTKGTVYVLGTFNNSPCEKHLYSMSYFDISQPVKRLTKGVGIHNVVMNHACTMFVDIFSCLERPPITSIYMISEVPGGMPIHICDMHDALDDRTKTLGLSLQPPEIISVKTRDQLVDLFAAVYHPDPIEYGQGPYPAVVSTYGGPTIQFVTRSWGMTADMRAQLLRNLGFLVVKCDNRGSSRRGVLFEAWIKDRTGFIEVQDQEDVVKYLVQMGLVNPKHVGIYGWSYGGYLSAMCLLRAPKTFSVGICGAPVSNWESYSSHYSERYMGQPNENGDGYKESSLLSHVSKLEGKILLIHGLMDENVHFRHTASLIGALIKANKPYDLQVFPNGRHWTSDEQSRVHMEQIVVNYLVQHLKPSNDSAVNTGGLSSNTVSPLGTDRAVDTVVSLPPPPSSHL